MNEITNEIENSIETICMRESCFSIDSCIPFQVEPAKLFLDTDHLVEVWYI